MFRRKMYLQLLFKAGMGLLTLCLVGVLLAAIPGHHAPALPQVALDPLPFEERGVVAGSRLDAGVAAEIEEQAMSLQAADEPLDAPHLRRTLSHPANAEERERASKVLEQLRAEILKYEDYRAALRDGFRILKPDLPQKEYHFRDEAMGDGRSFEHRPARPSSLLYRKTREGYELVGAIYTMPVGASEEQLNEQVPLSVATWYLPTNLCLPGTDQKSSTKESKFGTRGSIHTAPACHAAGGTFYPAIAGWMVLVPPYDSTLARSLTLRRED